MDAGRVVAAAKRLSLLIFIPIWFTCDDMSRSSTANDMTQHRRERNRNIKWVLPKFEPIRFDGSGMDHYLLRSLAQRNRSML